MKQILFTYVIKDDGTRILLLDGQDHSHTELFSFNTHMLNNFESSNEYVNLLLGASIRSCEMEAAQ